MYTVAKAPSRLASTANRRGPAQLIRLESYDTENREPFGSWDSMSSPKAVFNGRKHLSKSNSDSLSSNGMSNSTMTHQDNNQQHEENVRFIAEAWQRVTYELERKNSRDDGPEIYREKFPFKFQGFEPLDLEQWWYNRINMKN